MNIYDRTISNEQTIVISSGELASNPVINSGGSLSVSSGGTLSGGTALTGGAIGLAAGGLIAGQPIIYGALSGGTVTGAFSVVTGRAGADLRNITALSQGGIYVSSGATLTGATAMSGGSIYLFSGGLMSGGTVFAGGTLTANSASLISGQPDIYGGMKGGTVSGPFAVVTGQAGADIRNVTTISQGGIYLNSGARLSNAVAGAGGTIHVFSGGSSFNTVRQADGYIGIRSGGTETVTSGIGSGATALGMGRGGTPSQIGAILIGSGGTGIDETADGGYIAVQGAGAASINAIIKNRGWQDVGFNNRTNAAGGGVASGSTLIDGGIQYISSGGQAQATVIGSGGSQVIYAGATAISSVVNAAGTIFTSSGGLDVGTTIVSGGSVVVRAGGTTTNMIVSSGGSATIASGGVIGGTLTLAGGGEATVDAQTTGTIDLGGSSHAKVTIAGTGSPSIRMLGFNGDHAGLSDQIVLNDIRKSDIVSVSYPDADHVALHLRQGGVFVMFIPGVQQAGYALVAGDNGQTIFEVCYLAGTLIDTPQGRRPVETLRPGDPVYCYSDSTRHVEIIQFCGEGYKRVDADLPLTLAGYPVEVAAHAFGPDAPCQNLLVTPEHCLFLDGKLVPSRLLVDGHAIKYRTDMTAYKYYHIETQKHRLIDCNGILSETYLDTGNRAIFTHHEALEGFTPQQRLWSRDAVAPLVTQADTVLQIRKKFPALQGRSGRSEDLLQTPYLQTASGRRIPPMRCDCNRVVFLLRERTDCFYLCSDTHIPSECYGCHLDDRRSLGVLAGEIDLYSPSGARSLTRHLQRARLPGWHEGDNGQWRWTAGSGLVTLEEADIEFPCIVSVQVAHAHYRAR